jgi:hypothetical protein
VVNGTNAEAVVGPDLAAPVTQSPQIRAKSGENPTGKLRSKRRLSMRQRQIRNEIKDLG